jgi:hypothetical protein
MRESRHPIALASTLGMVYSELENILVEDRISSGDCDARAFNHGQYLG